MNAGANSMRLQGRVIGRSNSVNGSSGEAAGRLQRWPEKTGLKDGLAGTPGAAEAPTLHPFEFRIHLARAVKRPSISAKISHLSASAPERVLRLIAETGAEQQAWMTAIEEHSSLSGGGVVAGVPAALLLPSSHRPNNPPSDNESVRSEGSDSRPPSQQPSPPQPQGTTRSSPLALPSELSPAGAPQGASAGQAAGGTHVSSAAAAAAAAHGLSSPDGSPAKNPPAMAAMIRDLEEQKRAAVAIEDYDEAKRLKLRIEELRGGGR